MTVYQTYCELVSEIHLAVNSGDDTALQGVAGMLAKREELEQTLGIDTVQAKTIHDEVVGQAQ